MCIRLYDFAGHCESLVFLEFWCSACYVFSHHWVWVSCVQGTFGHFLEGSERHHGSLW